MGDTKSKMIPWKPWTVVIPKSELDEKDQNDVTNAVLSAIAVNKVLHKLANTKEV